MRLLLRVKTYKNLLGFNVNRKTYKGYRRALGLIITEAGFKRWILLSGSIMHVWRLGSVCRVSLSHIPLCAAIGFGAKCCINHAL